MYRDTDGYIIIDLKGIDVSRASQSVPGLYEKVEPVLDANKLVIVNNAGNHTPLPGSCIKSSNYIRITTDIYIFTINSNNILIIEANGSSITVDVSIIPAYSEGTKIADFEINGQSGELYIPAYPDIINDSVASDHTVYSSDKVNTLLSGKADTSDIPTKTSDLDNDSGFITSSDIPAIPDDLNDLSDVDISSASDAQVLTYDALSGKWVNATSPTGVTALSQLSDVTITTPASGNSLVYDGTEWINDTLGAADIPYSAGVSVADALTEKMNHIKDMSAASSGHPTSTDLLAVSDGTNEYKVSVGEIGGVINAYSTVEVTSANTNVTITLNNSYKVGNIVFVNVIFTITTAITGNDTPLFSITGQNATVRADAFAVEETTNKGIIGYIKANENTFKKNLGVMNADKYWINFAYVSE